MLALRFDQESLERWDYQNLWQHEAFAIAWFAKLEMRGDLIGSKCSVEYIKDLGASMKKRLADAITMTDCFEEG